MKSFVRFLIATVGPSLSLGLAQVKAGDTGLPPVLTVCEVLSAPQRYDGHLVRVRGRIGGTDEGSWLFSDDCRGVFVTGEYIWPSVISLAMPTLRTPLRLHPVDFEFDWDSRRRTLAKFERLRKSAPQSCMVFTYSGMFETRGDWAVAKMRYADGTWRYAGFGHLGDAPGQLLLKSEDDVTVTPNCDDKGKPHNGRVER